MSANVLIRRGRLIDPRNRVNGVRDVLIRDGKVAEVSERPLPAPGPGGEWTPIDASGLWVLPGFIDLHVHLREPGEEGKETVLTGSRAAVAGGFTGVVAMPNTRPPNDSPLVTRFVLDRAREAGLCRVYPAGTISKGLEGKELSEMGLLVEAGCVCFTDDGRPVMSAGLMRRALQYSSRFEVPVSVHAEDLTLSASGCATEGERATRLGLGPIPASAEAAMVARDLVLAEEVGTRLHVAHVSCEASVRLIREAKRRGVRVTAEATPHHLTLTDEAIDGYDTHAKMSPPLRSERDVQAVRQGLADGTIDAVATDHAPHGILDKQCEFDRAANGVVGLETALPLALALVRAGVLTPERLAAVLSFGPAEAFRLPGGHLGVGAPGDVSLVDPEAEWRVDPGRFLSKGRNTPIEGRVVKGRVERTLVGGRVVYEAGAIR
ncbi:MAG: dihydroorotase [Myxococcales bacterium]|nr:dihydroorotase [Myxococcales bacterium]